MELRYEESEVGAVRRLTQDEVRVIRNAVEGGERAAPALVHWLRLMIGDYEFRHTTARTVHFPGLGPVERPEATT